MDGREFAAMGSLQFGATAEILWVYPAKHHERNILVETETMAGSPAVTGSDGNVFAARSFAGTDMFLL